MTKSRKFLISILAVFVLYTTYEIGNVVGFKNALDANSTQVANSLILIIKQRNILREQQELLEALGKEVDKCSGENI